VGRTEKDSFDNSLRLCRLCALALNSCLIDTELG
jgi:hypothetical protein